MTPAQGLLLEEYKDSRDEVRDRVQFLHQTLNLGVVLQVVALIIWIGLVALNVSAHTQNTYLLLLPIAFATLTFNYQANQMTLEAVAGFGARLHSHPDFKSEHENWEQAFGKHKKHFEITSFLKIMPVMLPLLLPFIVLQREASFPSAGNGILCTFDIALFLLVIVNFRYKAIR